MALRLLVIPVDGTGMSKKYIRGLGASEPSTNQLTFHIIQRIKKLQPTRERSLKCLVKVTKSPNYSVFLSAFVELITHGNQQSGKQTTNVIIKTIKPFLFKPAKTSSLEFDMFNTWKLIDNLASI